MRVALAILILLLTAACGGGEGQESRAPRTCLAAWNDENNPNLAAVPETMGVANVARGEAGCSFVFHDYGHYVSYSGSWGDDGLEWQPEQRGDWTAARQRTALDDYVVAEDRRLRPLAPASRMWGRGCRPVGRSGGRTYELCRELGDPGPQHVRKNPAALVVEEGGARRVVHLEPPRGNTDAQPMIGHWERAVLSPDGRTLLLQWSAECETQFTFLADARGGAPRPALRPRPKWWDAPSSGAVGWESARTAVVEVIPGCGSSAERRRVGNAVSG